jgi:IS5 family transposase
MKKKHPKMEVRMKGQPGFFDQSERLWKLSQMGDPLVRLAEVINWELFRPILDKAREQERKSNAGAKPTDAVLMFKLMVLQRLHNLSDDQAEYQVRDRTSFQRFLGLRLEDPVPDAKTLWAFKDRLARQELVVELFARFDQHLTEQGYVAKGGQIIDATLVEVPRQRNTPDENRAIKAGTVPEDWKDKPAKLAQKDPDARWTKKRGQTYYGYKNHINADEKHKLIRDYDVTDAAVHDSQVIDDLLDTENKERAVYADSAYRSVEREAALQGQDMKSEICEKGTRGHPLTDEQKATNRAKARVRVRVEHIFGFMTNSMGGIFMRTIGLLRAKATIGMMNLTYNLSRYAQLVKPRMRPNRVGAPVVA